MKRKLLSSFAASLFMLAAQAQVTLTSAVHGPSITDVTSYYNVDTNGIFPGAAGNNQTWNFSSIITTGTPSTTSYVSVASTPYASQFTSSSFAVQASTSYNYFQSNSSGLYITGLANSTYTLPYTNSAQILSFPMSFGNVVTDTYNGTYTINPLTTWEYGVSTINADGQGTLNLPSGSYNTLRLKRTRVQTDSIVAFSLTTLATTIIEEYQWYTANKKYPIFGITTTTFVSQSSALTVKIVYLDASVASVNELELFGQLQIFPNPSSGPITITGDLPQQSELMLQVLDMNGRVCFTQNIGDQPAGAFRYDLPEGTLSQGVYQLSLSSGEGRSVRRIVIE